MSFIMLLTAGFLSWGVTCTYSMKPSSVEVHWTGYKLTSKKGVSGVFKEVKVASPDKAASINQLIGGTSFVIDSMSVDSGNSARDENLRSGFFKMMKTPYIKGFIDRVKGDSATVMLSMNGTSKLIPFTFKKKGNSLEGTARVNILNFLMKPSLSELNKRCKDLHRGKDGKSKTWSDVDLVIKAKTVAKCK